MKQMQFSMGVSFLKWTETLESVPVIKALSVNDFAFSTS